MIFQRISHLIIALFILFFNCDIKTHGFAANTSIITDKSHAYLSIEQLAFAIKKNKTQYVKTYDSTTRNFTEKRARAAGVSETNCYCTLSFDNDVYHDIVCTPSQQFYRISDRQWVEAYMLKEGDLLLCDNNRSVELRAMTFTIKPLKVYTIEVKKTHTFLVGHYHIVTHNMFVPLAATLAPLGTGCGAGSIGAIFGPIGVVGGVVLGGAIGCIVALCMKERFAEYKLSFKVSAIESLVYTKEKESKSEDAPSKEKSNEAQAPGKPTENDGFVPKKNWEGKKIKHPITGQHGWQDKKGNVWVPTGPGPMAHGGPHWDVVSEDGKRHWNVVPGGRIRGEK